MGIKQPRSRESKTRDGDLEIEIRGERTRCRSVSLQLLSPSLAEASESNLSLCEGITKHTAEREVLTETPPSSCFLKLCCVHRIVRSECFFSIT